MSHTQDIDAQGTDQTANCVDEGPSQCRAIDAVLSQAYLQDILQQMRSAFKLSIYGIPIHLGLATVASVVFWSGATRHVPVVANLPLSPSCCDSSISCRRSSNTYP